MTDAPIYKLVSRKWNALPTKGDDVTIKDPKLKQGYLGDLKKKTVLELEEVYERNKNVLSNKALLSKLKDKGKSLQARQEEIAKALEEARERENSHRKVPDQKDVHGFEWTGSLTNNSVDHGKVCEKEDLYEDGDDLHPLELMAHHSSVIDHREIKSRLAEDDPASAIARELEQLELSDSKQGEETLQDKRQFGVKRDEMIQKKYEQNGPPKVSFKPFRPLHPTPTNSRPVICISQEESIKREKDYLNKEKERELKLTIEGLARPNKVSGITTLPSNPVGNYRDTNLSKHILDSDEEEDEETDGEAFLASNYDDPEDDDDGLF
ncbi:uncharacterized protein Polr2M [Palaemon carinicauda]|uniref:uncharacterized protein Polr2M n=1 Tax=Palaemon carinicauda TaxID=392227 RepID=UPI0035B5F41E